MMSEADNTLLYQLLQLVNELRAQTEGYEQRQDDAQQWYDRGYADGIIQTLYARGYRDKLRELGGPDTPAVASVSAHLPWGEAYHHGLQMGERETCEVLDQRA